MARKTEKIQQPILQDEEGNIIKALPKKKSPFKNWAFLFLWLYLVAKILFTDVDLVVAQLFGLTNTALYLFLRFLVVGVVLMLLWLKIGNKRFWGNVGLFLIFPIYPGLWILLKGVVWEIPKYFYKKNLQLVLYYYLESILGFIFNFKFIVLKFAIFFLAFTGLFAFSGLWLVIPITLFLILQIAHIYKRIKQTFSPVKIFRLELDTFESPKNQFTPESIDEAFAKEIEKKDLDEHGRAIKHMERYLMMAEFIKAINLRVKSIINSRTYMLSFFGKTLFSFLISVVYFSGINYAIYKINPSAFKIANTSSYFDFMYYSFFLIFPEGVDIEPVTMISKIARMAGVFTSAILNLLLLAFYLTISNERLKENLNNLIKLTDKYSQDIENHFELKYGHSPKEGIEKIKNFGIAIESSIKTLRKLINPK